MHHIIVNSTKVLQKYIYNFCNFVIPHIVLLTMVLAFACQLST